MRLLSFFLSLLAFFPAMRGDGIGLRIVRQHLSFAQD